MKPNHTQDFPDFIYDLTPGFTPVIGGDYLKEDYVFIDLSANNRDLLRLEVASSEAFSMFIDEFLKNRNAKAAYGGYNELRTLYNRSELFNNNKEANRNIHIGLDIWVPAYTDILSPLDGSIHSFRDNDNFGDYGPTIILEHSQNDRTFYTLYGHLSRASLETLAVGDRVRAGDKIAELGDFHENGDYAPHLHFQIMESMQGNIGDYPGVIKKEDQDNYLQNCPDPNLLLKI
ncbi:peptidoglycan DD-metalloendopeptidase family protein [Christiangramia sabulilitoris]|uniref:Peptidoglycan DD-metalloendopeptidase family protein n=1 Tax=Christiangramia sabulilitoris TaxID=2583991 RepID=A0A550HYY7_9FLAO|nr:peptidoglycan DD-metalloendopeptidase family protein [Christiangramia sabulilitoris]TRO63949.1 peptidoglycan DD-metalloendopeptidase family protein [Christiangramia sabulilitoris]